MIRFLKDRMSSISSDLYEEILKSSKSYTSRIIQIVPCMTTLTGILIGKRFFTAATSEGL